LLDTPNIPGSAWTEPPGGVASAIGGDVPQFLIGVAAGSGNDLTITLTTAINGVQDMCSPTTQVPASGVNYPNIEISAPNFPIHVVVTPPNPPDRQAESTAHNVFFKNILPGDTAAKDGELDATVDASELYTLFYQLTNATKDNICAQLDSIANTTGLCKVCDFNQLPYCLTLHVVQIGATQTPTAIVPVLSGDIDPSCHQ